MIYYKTQGEVEILRENCLLVCRTIAHAASILRPGITAKALDTAAETFIRDHHAEPGFKGYHGFPATLCISKNEAVVHGIPSDEVFENGDVVSIDCGVYKNDYFGDAAYTFVVGEVDDAVMKLLAVTRKSLYLGIEQAVAGNRLGDIGYAIQQYAEKKHGYGVVRELVGHGIGRDLHESPEVPNYGRRGRGPKLKEGLVIAIEPMINLGKRDIVQKEDGWTVVTRDNKPSAHYEHTVVVQKYNADILSDHAIIEASVKNNSNLQEISKKT